jgi:hypothetical protein
MGKLMTGGQRKRVERIRKELRQCQVDRPAVRELTDYATNDGDLYRQMTTPNLINLADKKVKGTYNPNLAIVAFRNIADAAAKRYDTGGRSWRGKTPSWASPCVRTHTAIQLASHYKEEIREYAQEIRKKGIKKVRMR